MSQQLEVYNKFIIEKINGKLHLIMGKCTYHRELTPHHKNVIGGGWWERKLIDNKIIFLGSSDEFGAAKVEDIECCVKYGRVFTNRRLNKNISEDFEFHVLSETIAPIQKLFNIKLSDEELYFALQNRFKNHFDENLLSAIEKITSELKLKT